MGKSLVSCFLTHGVDGSDPLFSIIFVCVIYGDRRVYKNCNIKVHFSLLFSL